ncbi:MAG TPA: hypothetical protein PLB10_17145 [Thiolinea sp.]|nr:hypothetical protein [Thiolinea sp.]
MHIQAAGCSGHKPEPAIPSVVRQEQDGGQDSRNFNTAINRIMQGRWKEFSRVVEGLRQAINCPSSSCAEDENKAGPIR